MQFYIISPLFLFIYWKRPKIGLSLVFIVLAASLVTTGILNVDRGYYARASSPGHAWTDVIYVKPYVRIAPYLVGVLFAFLYLHVESRRRESGNKNFGMVPFYLEVAVVLGAVALISLLVFVTHNNYGPDPWPPSDVRSILWDVFSRPLWAVCVAALVHLYATGHGVLFGSILSAGLWTPLARLTFSAYLYHPVIMLASYFSLKALIHYDSLNMVLYCLGFTVLSYLTAFGSFLLIERPLVNLEKLILPHHR